MRETNLKLLREREKGKLPRERGGRIACELWLGRETWRTQREIVCESERFPNSTILEGISNPWIWAYQILVGFEIKSKSISFNLPKQRIWIWAPSNPNPCDPNKPLVNCKDIVPLKL